MERIRRLKRNVLENLGGEEGGSNQQGNVPGESQRKKEKRLRPKGGSIPKDDNSQKPCKESAGERKKTSPERRKKNQHIPGSLKVKRFKGKGRRKTNNLVGRDIFVLGRGLHGR